MKIPKYLSPTSLAVWEKNQEDYYLQYLADFRPPRIPQTQPMAVGAAFDAFVKSYLHEKLFGKGNDENFQIKKIFEDQVEEHNRVWAWEAGKYVFEAYQTSGALADLLAELETSQSEPRFEFTLQREIGGIPLLGKPDVFYVHRGGSPIILDFKVNGFCSKYPKSPDRGYLRVRDGWVGVPSRNANTMHKKVQPMRVSGIIVNVAENLEDINKDWATQLSTYAWLCGAEVGSEFVVAIDQIVATPYLPDRPKLRIAEHRGLISKEFQVGTLQRFSELWSIVNSNHIFRDVSLEESSARCQILDIQHRAFDDGDPFIREMTGRS